jgi:hypothetical protein
LTPNCKALLMAMGVATAAAAVLDIKLVISIVSTYVTIRRTMGLLMYLTT